MSDLTDPERKPLAKKSKSILPSWMQGEKPSDSGSPDEPPALRPANSKGHSKPPDEPPPPRSADSVARLSQPNERGQEGMLDLSTLLQNPDVRNVILKSNVFIFGKVGFFDRIIKALSNLYKEVSGKDIKTFRTNTDLGRLVRRKKGQVTAEETEQENEIETSEDFTSPIILFPTSDSDEGLNQLLAKALEKKRPIWVVALPSQIKRHLLLSFNCFFLATGLPADRNEDMKTIQLPADLNVISGITPAEPGDLEKLIVKGSSIQSIFLSDTKIDNIGMPNRLGTVVYIQQLK